MPENESRLIRAIEDRASRRFGELARDLVYAESKNKELALAEVDYQRSLCEACLDSRSVR